MSLHELLRVKQRSRHQYLRSFVTFRLCSLAELETTSTVQKDDRILEMKRSVEGKDNRIIELENRYYFESPCSMISFHAVGLVRAWHRGSWSEKIHPFVPH